MATFGHCGWVTGGNELSPFGTTRMRVLKCVLPADGLISHMTAAMRNIVFPPPGTNSNVKCLIYNENGGYPDALQGESDVQLIAAGQDEINVTFTFSPAISLVAGNYYVGILRDGGTAKVKVDGVGVLRTTPFDGGANHYNSPPATFPGGAATDVFNPWYCVHYTVVGNPYPTNLLKKGFISAYHCFMSAYIRAKITGYDPLKLPDGTLF